jgi:hypothetical protein
MNFPLTIFFIDSASKFRLFLAKYNFYFLKNTLADLEIMNLLSFANKFFITFSFF